MIGAVLLLLVSHDQCDSSIIWFAAINSSARVLWTDNRFIHIRMAFYDARLRPAPTYTHDQENTL